MSVWTVANYFDGPAEAHLTLSEEAVSAGTNPKTLNWNATDVPGLVPPPYGSPLEILGVRMELTPTSATNRRAKVQLQDSAGDVIFEVTSAVTINTTALWIIEFAAGFSPATTGIELVTGAPASTVARSPLPVRLFLLPGQKLVATQDAVIDANDALVVHVRARLRKR